MQRARAEARQTAWLGRLHAVSSESSPKVFVAPIAAGEKVVASTRSSIYKFLTKQHGNAHAVEMEGLGFLEALHANPNVGAIVVRGISDLIKKKAEADLAGSQELAARNASAFAFELLAKSSHGGGRVNIDPVAVRRNSDLARQGLEPHILPRIPRHVVRDKIYDALTAGQNGWVCLLRCNAGTRIRKRIRNQNRGNSFPFGAHQRVAGRREHEQWQTGTTGA